MNLLCLLHNSPCSRLNIYWTRAHPTGSWKSQVIFFFAIRQFFLYFFFFFWLFSLPCPKCFAMTRTSCDLYKDKASRPRAQNARVLSVGKKKIRSWLSRPTKTTAGCVDGMGTSLFKLARHRKQYSSLLQKTPRFEVRYISVVCCIYTRLLFSL